MHWKSIFKWKKRMPRSAKLYLHQQQSLFPLSTVAARRHRRTVRDHVNADASQRRFSSSLPIAPAYPCCLHVAEQDNCFLPQATPSTKADDLDSRQSAEEGGSGGGGGLGGEPRCRAIAILCQKIASAFCQKHGKGSEQTHKY